MRLFLWTLAGVALSFLGLTLADIDWFSATGDVVGQRAETAGFFAILLVGLGAGILFWHLTAVSFRMGYRFSDTCKVEEAAWSLCVAVLLGIVALVPFRDAALLIGLPYVAGLSPTPLAYVVWQLPPFILVMGMLGFIWERVGHDQDVAYESTM